MPDAEAVTFLLRSKTGETELENSSSTTTTTTTTTTTDIHNSSLKFSDPSFTNGHECR